ncbi:uncharacterized protein KGF55_000479 [Candida pseudojiufengensis]|uniref:uncharacterized protein n=1 Tax=Candida pseudojiufengensis TaxID=497109 RepID=UPI0022245A59|nr:uncharacterized protein KGF55_000479 [Candida pseudojiufengensis]KAI5966170.1 hypothetical protein KGF55_000479 [Candida pseudojiufengensis]
MLLTLKIAILFYIFISINARHLPPNITQINLLSQNITKKQDQEYNNLITSSLPKIYGVNLGGWLVTEPWITPSIYEHIEKKYGILPIDEYNLCKILGKVKAKQYLTTHYETFYNENDIEKISKLGLNLIRIPIGYWAFGLLEKDPYIQGQEYYLDLAVKWSLQYNLKFQIVLHGLPGSQNCFDNSGQKCLKPNWFEYDENLTLTYKILDYIVDKYGNMTNIHSIEVVNEPMGWTLDEKKLKDFYNYCINLFKEKNIKANLVLSDAFFNLEHWYNFPGNFILDHHLYEIFTDWQINYTFNEHINNIRSMSKRLKNTGHPSIVGEFSGAMDDCTKYLNGVGKGSRWEGNLESSTLHPTTGKSCKNRDNPNLKLSKPFSKKLRYFLKEQFYNFEKFSYGWIFWCWKTESSLVWDMERLNDLNLLPKPLFNYRLNIKAEIEKNWVNFINNTN